MEVILGNWSLSAGF